MLQDIASSVIADLIQFLFIILLGFGYARAGGKLSAANGRMEKVITMATALFHNVNKLDPDIRIELKKLIRDLFVNVATKGVGNFDEEDKNRELIRYRCFWKKHGSSLESFKPSILQQYQEFVVAVEEFLEKVVNARSANGTRKELAHVKEVWRRLFDEIYHETTGDLTTYELNNFDKLNVKAGQTRQFFKVVEAFSRPANSLKR